MKLRSIMTSPVIRVGPEEPVGVAARLLSHYNIGILPVVGSDGRLRGVVTDRDLVTRCLAAGKSPAQTLVREVMTSRVISARPDMEVGLAAGLMGTEQIRRLPVVENGKLCGMVSLGDIALDPDAGYDAGDALAQISETVSKR